MKMTLRQWITSAIVAVMAMTSGVWAQTTEYREVTDPALFDALQGMRGTQVQYSLYLFYTINMDTPGFIEIGGYNKREKDGDIKVSSFYRWRAGPIAETNEKLDFYLDANSRGFFMIHLPNGRRGYMRNGRFRLDTSGRLVSWQNSYPIVNAENDGFIYIAEGADVTVSRSGVVYSDAEPVGKMRVTVFSTEGLDKLTSLNGVLFVSSDGQVPEEIPGGDLNYSVFQGFIEENNVLKSIVGDVGFLKRTYESTSKAAKIVNRAMSNAVQMAHP